MDDIYIYIYIYGKNEYGTSANFTVPHNCTHLLFCDFSHGTTAVSDV